MLACSVAKMDDQLIKPITRTNATLVSVDSESTANVCRIKESLQDGERSSTINNIPNPINNDAAACPLVRALFGGDGKCLYT